MQYLGNYAAGSVARFMFNTRDSAQALITLAGTPSVRVRKLSTGTNTTTGVTLSVDSLATGAHLVAVDTSDSFYATGVDFAVYLHQGTVDGQSQANTVLAHFSIEHRFAGFADGAITAAKIADGALTSAKFADGFLTAAKIASDAITAAKIASNAITSSKIASDAITAAALAADCITGTKIADGAITSAKFTVGTITGVASGILEKMAQLWGRYFIGCQRDQDGLRVRTFQADGTTPATTQDASDYGNGNQTLGKASSV